MLWNNLPEETAKYCFDDICIDVVLPDNHAVKKQVDFCRQNNIEVDFPYWSKVWDSAIALSEFICKHSILIKDKNVLEIAGGLGLPSLLTSHFANQVTCTDYTDVPFHFLEKSIQANSITNVECKIYDWYSEPLAHQFDTVLLSDVNYEPQAFNAILKLVRYYLSEGTTIILSTPQRLQGKQFIEQLNKHIYLQETKTVNDNWIEIFVLRN